MSQLVSIITPSFNRENLIVETAHSILVQSYTNWEWIVVDDGSIDKTVNQLREFENQYPNIRIIQRSNGVKGACSCRNIGFRESKGEFVIFLDSDDLIAPFCLEQRVNAMNSDERNPDFIIFPSLIFKNKPYDLGLMWNKDSEKIELIRQLHQDAICQTSGVIWQRSAFERLGGWDERLFLWQDIDLFLRSYIENYTYTKRFDLLPDFHHRINDQSMSRSEIFSKEKKISRVIVIKKALNLLRSYEKFEFIRDLRFMLSEIVSGLIRTNDRTLAKKMIRWGDKEGILNSFEVRMLIKFSIVYLLRLYKLKIGQKYIEKVNEYFHTECTIAKVKL